MGENDADAKSATKEEDGEAEVYGLEGRLNVYARALGLGGDHGDVLGADDGKRGVPETGKEAFESTKGARVDVLLECAGILPVVETVSPLVGVAANHCHKCEAKEQEDKDDLATRKPKFGLTVATNS